MAFHKSVLLLFATSVLSASFPQRSQDVHAINYHRRQIPGYYSNLKGGKVADPPGAAPRKQVLQTPSKIPGVQRVKIRSGPYKVVSMAEKSFSGHAGMLENYPDIEIDKPSEEDFTLLWQQAGLEYANGTDANVDSGMWLHHMLHYNTGPGRWDATTYERKMCLPFVPIEQTPKTSERFYTAGNERTPLNYNPEGTSLASGSGYHVTKQDTFQYLIELMNMNMEDQVVYLTMTYDFLPGPLPAGWNVTKSVWLDAGQCTTSDLAAPQESGAFTVESVPWSPNFEGKVIGAMVHQHDGGVDVEVKPTADTTLCRGVAKYSESSAYVYRGTSMGGDKVAKDHISSMRGCAYEDMPKGDLEFKRGQKWSLKGNYDYDRYEGNLESGKQAEIMVLGIVLVSIPPGLHKPIA